MKRFLAVICVWAFVAFQAGCAKSHDTTDSFSPTPRQTAGHDMKMSPQAMSECPHCKSEPMATAEPSGLSIYNLDAKWQNQDNQEVSLDANRGKIVVVAMIYTSCKGACPRIISDMRDIESKCAPKRPDQIKYVLVSFDPEVDTPERLKATATETGLGPNWELLRGPSNQVLELAALLGVKYRKTGDKDYAHSNLITVLNPEGEIAYQQEGLGVSPDKTLEVIRDLVSR